MRKTVLALAAVGMVGALAGCTNPFSGDPQAGMNAGDRDRVPEDVQEHRHRV